MEAKLGENIPTCSSASGKGGKAIKGKLCLKKELETIIETIYDGVILSDAEGRIFWCNSGVERISGGIKAEEVLGKTSKELEEEGLIVTQSKKILGKNPMTLRQTLKTGVELLITSTRAYDDKGNFKFFVANLRDITELNRIKKEMEETRDLSNRYYQELTQLRDKLFQQGRVIYKSEKMQKVFERVMKIAKTDTNVLITGPSGAGKGVIAKCIHRLSKRNKEAFVQINCGAIPEALLESELFGYEKGAFTGANKLGKMGLMEMANNGTILLDEIGDLSISLQVKLLRAIQEQIIYRVGSTDPVQLNVRIIAATNRDLEEMVEEGGFREDLYYRLNVIPIYLPPLRKRKEDILPLAFDFLERYNRKHNTEKSFSVEVCNLLEAYNWPGNVRELENMVERMVVISDNKILTKECLPPHLWMKDMDDLLDGEEGLEEAQPILPLREIRNRAEREAIERALALGGTTRKAAKLLEVDHSTVVRKAKQLNINI